MGSCENIHNVQKDSKVVTSILLFSTGLLGNTIALAILGKHKWDSKKVSVFYILVTGLVLTDLFGKCLISPVVFASYASNLTLKAMGSNNTLCNYFSFSMSFFGLSSMFILFAMALECWLSISHPFFYQEHFTKRLAVLILPVVYICCLLFCSMPLLGVGSTKQYCPGTWCFFNMNKPNSSFSVLYATLMAVLIVAVILCNSSVAINLTKMYRRQRRMSNPNLSVVHRSRRQFSHSEEMENLILLVLMSIIFLICSLPLTVRAYIGAFAPDESEEGDLIALRLASVNSIVDPWVFIIFRTSLFRKLLLMCCKFSPPTLRAESWSINH
ncbi:prostaglandin D2 receptor-like [Hemiscyllium ocellatum]|uniref:prostaglandin D2 receptor-like n=1 Tax=Hemiscyllium ocellatum TaxID=170820 RepID=UPI0029670351|nr:prostaglandin D2 receptor-like [Hemiscyllium ocellatum]